MKDNVSGAVLPNPTTVFGITFNETISPVCILWVVVSAAPIFVVTVETILSISPITFYIVSGFAKEIF